MRPHTFSQVQCSDLQIFFAVSNCFFFHLVLCVLVTSHSLCYYDEFHPEAIAVISLFRLTIDLINDPAKSNPLLVKITLNLVACCFGPK